MYNISPGRITQQSRLKASSVKVLFVRVQQKLLFCFIAKTKDSNDALEHIMQASH